MLGHRGVTFTPRTFLNIKKRATRAVLFFLVLNLLVSSLKWDTFGILAVLVSFCWKNLLEGKLKGDDT